ncbi:hypothetical protein ES708_13411 [subsurface metagenome]
MAHRFENFAEAYAELDSHLATYRDMVDKAIGYVSDAKDYANGLDWKNGIKYNGYAIGCTLSAFDIIFQLYSFALETSMFGECLYWASQEGGNGEIDMTAILDAMWKAKPHQCLLFIPMIDAMRGSIQNKTVTSQYMADALKHFMQ